ncbi:MAG: hypothetical protein VW405_04760, partial [Rhodospirillaceae bacterium]
DPKYPQKFLLHDYFFAKSLDAVRPGGLLAFISSAGTMNKNDTKAREYLAERADFVGAIRLPSTAFKQNAGTEVTTDIIFLRKKVDGAPALPDARWVETVETTLPDFDGKPRTGRVNPYFVDHPDMVLGEEGFFDKLYQGRYAVKPKGGSTFLLQIENAVKALPENVMSAWQDTTDRAEIDFGTSERKDGSFYIGRDGALMQQSDGVGRPVERRGKGVQGGRSLAEVERIKALVPIRDALRAVYVADLAEDTKNAAAARKRLNDSYDEFAKRFGPINKADFSYRRPNIVQQENARAEAREEARFAGEVFEEGSFDPSAMIADKASTQAIGRARADARKAAEARGERWDEGSFDPVDMPDVVIVKRPNIDPFMDDPESYRLRAIEHYNETTGEASKGAVFRENVITREKPPEINSVGDAVLYVLNTKGRFDIEAVAHAANMSKGDAIEALGDRLYRIPTADGSEVWDLADAYLSGNVRAKLAEAQAAAQQNPDFRRNVTALEQAQPAPLPPTEIAASLGMPWIKPE